MNPWGSKVEKDIKKRRFLVRDWSVWLGWNNGRYVIETALALATLLDRELVLPGFHFANTCEGGDNSICDSLVPSFKKDVPFDLKDINDLSQYPESFNGTIVMPPVPTQNNIGWVVPIDAFLDTDNTVSVLNKNAIKFQDFLKLTSYKNKNSLGMVNGSWSINFAEEMTYRRIMHSFFTEGGLTNVDKLPKPVEPLITNSTYSNDVPKQVIEECKATLDKMAKQIKLEKRSENKYRTWDGHLIQDEEMTQEFAEKDHPLLERCIASKGLRSVYSFQKIADWMKAPYGETKNIMEVKKMRGIYDELKNYDEQVLHIEGEIHNLLPPASMVWSTIDGREEYKKIVRKSMRPPKIYQTIAAKLELKMRAKCSGRSWVASHLRRGDFVGMGWADEDILIGWNRIQEGVAYGIEILKKEPKLLEPINKALKTSLELPSADDPIYIATNARSQKEIDFLRAKKVVLLQDLLDEDDKRELGKLASSFMDTLSILEQCLIMRSAFYFGDAQSSFTGTILNRRMFYGIDERLSKIEYFNM
ncbi:hypothetical protein PPACK8108_LOCUS24550 [Phakopsora pachyrhizi]|uniref:Uncharacterized protein n=1 Tax=Phakopsora pachyrhizi TaxID=170000 RepID=A0AAV0BQ38_PHAPC|nr:hypothetical protein PPACK8108_LOCUS24550 [Phakopsora pachyrhizi]